MNNTTSTTTTTKLNNSNNNNNKKRQRRRHNNNNNTRNVLILVLVISLVTFQFITFKPPDVLSYYYYDKSTTSSTSTSTTWSSSSTSTTSSTTTTSETPPPPSTTTTAVVSSNNNITTRKTNISTSPTTANTSNNNNNNTKNKNNNETPVVVVARNNNKNKKNNNNEDDDDDDEEKSNSIGGTINNKEIERLASATASASAAKTVVVEDSKKKNNNNKNKNITTTKTNINSNTSTTTTTRSNSTGNNTITVVVKNNNNNNNNKTSIAATAVNNNNKEEKSSNNNNNNNNNILASKILMDNDVSALFKEGLTNTNNNKGGGGVEIKFEPGSLSSLSSVEVLNYCYTNTTLYKNHFHEPGGFRFAASDVHKLIYLFLPKSSSSTTRSMLKKRFDAYEKNTGKYHYQRLIDVNEPYTNYTAFTFVRDPLSRFFSGYDEGFVREAPWNHAHRQKGAKQITPSYIHEGLQYWWQFVDVWCPPSSRVNATSTTDRSECHSSTFKTAENGTLAARLTRYVNESDFGLAPFNPHLKLQVPLLTDPKTGYKARVDEIYTMDDIESTWEYLSKRHNVNLSEPLYSMRHKKIVEGVVHDRPRSRREDMTKISNETKQRICEFGLLDYCCLNMKLPSPCTNLFCKLQYLHVGNGGGGGKQQQNNNGGKNYRLQIQPWSFPFPT